MALSLTGIKPTNKPHLGNYLGAIRPGLRLTKDHGTAYFIADYHALTSVRDRAKLNEAVYDVAATWLACGLDPSKTLFFRQSAIPEVFELAWVLSCLLATGQLERGHSYKDALAKGEAPNAGVFFYPVLMAADILLYDTTIVPVGKDQQQHLELARDVATRFNHVFGNALVVPEARIGDAPLVPGTDGEKMSKSKGNSIPLFAPPKKLRKLIMSIKTGSESLEEPKDPESSVVWQICKQVSPAAANSMAERLRAGGYGWGHAKEQLYNTLEAELGPLRERYEQIRPNEDAMDSLLSEGAARAAKVAQTTMRRVREVTGLRKRDAREHRSTVKLKPADLTHKP